MKEAVSSEINVVGIIVLVVTLAAYSLFLLSHRAKTNLWRKPASSSAHLDDEGLKKKGLASSGLYLTEILSLAAGCFLLAVSLRLLGLAGTGLWLLSAAASFFAALVLAPISIREARRTKLVGKFVNAAARLGGILVGSPRAMPLAVVEEAGGPSPPVESKRSSDLLQLLLRLRERQTSDVMVSRVDMICADECSTVSEVADLVKETAYNRIPVFSGTIDSISGYVTAKDVVIRLHQGGGAERISSIARKPVFVLSGAALEHALEEMQRAGVTLAIVIDRSGRTAGLVTGEDILEEVVGDLYEDYQPEEPAYQVIDDRTAIVRANVALGDLKEILGAVPSADLGRTLGDYVRKQLGIVPFKGERVSDDVFFYSVLKTTGKAIWSLKVEKRS